MDDPTPITNLVQQVLRRCAPYPAEVTVTSTEQHLTRFANNAIHQNVHEMDTAVNLRLLDGYRLGLAATNHVDPAGLDELVARARLLAKAGPEDPDFPGFSDSGQFQSATSFDSRTASCPPSHRADQVSALCRLAAGAGLNASGAYATGWTVFALGNTQGTAAVHTATLADFQTVVMSDDSSGHAHCSAWRIEDLPVEQLGREAVDKAVRGRGPRNIEPGEYPVVLDPYATHDMLGNLDFHGMGANAVQEGNSWMNNRLGQPAMHPQVSIWDDGLDPTGLPLPFDHEGTLKKKTDIVRQGTVIGPVYDRRTARKAGVESSGHALAPEYRAFTPAASNLFMHPGDASLEEMLSGTSRGLYITRFWYTRLVHPRDCVVTGMTRDGVFMIENGELAYPVKNLRFTQSYVQAFAEIESIGRETRLLLSAYGDIATRVPALKLARFNFTGSTV